jgi:hypothetical protein
MSQCTTLPADSGIPRTQPTRCGSRLGSQPAGGGPHHLLDLTVAPRRHLSHPGPLRGRNRCHAHRASLGSVAGRADELFATSYGRRRVLSRYLRALDRLLGHSLACRIGGPHHHGSPSASRRVACSGAVSGTVLPTSAIPLRHSAASPISSGPPWLRHARTGGSPSLTTPIPPHLTGQLRAGCGATCPRHSPHHLRQEPGFHPPHSWHIVPLGTAQRTRLKAWRNWRTVLTWAVTHDALGDILPMKSSVFLAML